MFNKSNKELKLYFFNFNKTSSIFVIQVHLYYIDLINEIKDEELNSIKDLKKTIENNNLDKPTINKNINKTKNLLTNSNIDLINKDISNNKDYLTEIMFTKDNYYEYIEKFKSLHTSIINDNKIKIYDIPKFPILVNSKILPNYYKDIFTYLYCNNNNKLDIQRYPSYIITLT